MKTNAQTKQLSRSAFTLIELLASSVLAALLLLAIFSMLRVVLSQENRARDRTAAAAQLSVLAAQLQRDFVNADRMSISAQRVGLFGMLQKDPRTLLPSFKPAAVNYYVKQIDDRRWLVRDQVTGGRTKIRHRRTELLWPDISEFKVLPLIEPTANGKPSNTSPFMSPHDLLVTLRDTSGNTLLSQRVSNPAGGGP